MIDARKDIIFRDEHYKEKFRIKDGDSIKVTVAYDGEELVRKCRFLDSAHMEVGSSIDTFHMDEFMERQARAGNTYEPVPNPEPKLDILFAEPGQEPRDKEVPISITYLRSLVDGPLAMVPVGMSAAVLFPNPGDDVFNRNGAFAVVGMNDGKPTSLHPYEARRIKHQFRSFALDPEKIPLLFTQMEKMPVIPIDPTPEKLPTLKEQLAAAQKDVAAQKGAKQIKAASRQKAGESI